jgi:transposase
VTKISMFAIDIAKSVLQVVGAEETGKPVLNRPLRRGQVLAFFARQGPAVIGMEACGSAHYWARELRALGHEVRLIPAQYVKPYVKRNKTDARDAEAILEAMQRPTMRFVPVKSVDQQCDRAVMSARDLLVRQATQLANATRGLAYEMGVITPAGAAGMAGLLKLIDQGDSRLPSALLPMLEALAAQWRSVKTQIQTLDRHLRGLAAANPVTRRLMTIPNVGPLTAHAAVAAIGDGKQFSKARDFVAWVGLTPRQFGTGGKQRSGRISRAGDDALRRLLVLGASSGLRQVRARPAKASKWFAGLLARKPAKVAVVAQAAKTARIIWAILTSGQDYRAPTAA